MAIGACRVISIGEVITGCQAQAAAVKIVAALMHPKQARLTWYRRMEKLLVAVQPFMKVGSKDAERFPASHLLRGV